mmetsp:Transcript_14396/g.48141  ORF Transcript_14396/g.48141 Transcript_14396/m.48141 type:complete len:190 (+) Transcript_14396:64-633(+)
MMQRLLLWAALLGAVAEGLAQQNVGRRTLLVSAPALVAPIVARADGPVLPSDLADLSALVEKARRQLDPVPGLIENRKWDAIRAILITPPLSDCWSKNAKPLLRSYASALGATPNGDELAALEAREEAVTHLQFLDMASYNNNFSPAGGEMKVAASKELIKQYDELPRDELKATVAAMDALVKLASDAA